jgi:hypothetical protein
MESERIFRRREQGSTNLGLKQKQTGSGFSNSEVPLGLENPYLDDPEVKLLEEKFLI